MPGLSWTYGKPVFFQGFQFSPPIQLSPNICKTYLNYCLKWRSPPMIEAIHIMLCDDQWSTYQYHLKMKHRLGAVTHTVYISNHPSILEIKVEHWLFFNYFHLMCTCKTSIYSVAYPFRTCILSIERQQLEDTCSAGITYGC